MEKGTLYFFTGLAGAGKTTIGGLFYRRLKAKKDTVVLIDGDQLRDASPSKTRDYTTAGRLNGARGTVQWCRLLTEQGFDVVCCSIAMYDEVRELNRRMIGNYREIYIKARWETLCRRKPNLYVSDEKNVVGKDLPYDEPKTPDMVIDNDGQETPEAIVERIERLPGLEGA